MVTCCHQRDVCFERRAQLEAFGLSREEYGSDRLVEVKITNGWERTPFYITRNELAVAEVRREDWWLVRLWHYRTFV